MGEESGERVCVRWKKCAESPAARFGGGREGEGIEQECLGWAPAQPEPTERREERQFAQRRRRRRSSLPEEEKRQEGTDEKGKEKAHTSHTVEEEEEEERCSPPPLPLRKKRGGGGRQCCKVCGRMERQEKKIPPIFARWRKIRMTVSTTMTSRGGGASNPPHPFSFSYTRSLCTVL